MPAPVHDPTFVARLERTREALRQGQAAVVHATRSLVGQGMVTGGTDG